MEAVRGNRLLVIERIVVVVCLGEIALFERVVVGDQRAAPLEIPQIRLQGRGVHGDERVDFVSGREDVVAGKAELESADAGQRTGGGANFGGKVGKRADVIAERRGNVRELSAGQLHSVATVSAETNDDGFDRFNRFVIALRGGLVSNCHGLPAPCCHQGAATCCWRCSSSRRNVRTGIPSDGAVPEG